MKQKFEVSVPANSNEVLESSHSTEGIEAYERAVTLLTEMREIAGKGSDSSSPVITNREALVGLETRAQEITALLKSQIMTDEQINNFFRHVQIANHPERFSLGKEVA